MEKRKSDKCQVDNCSEILQSVLYHLINQQQLVKEALICGEQEIDAYFNNIFENNIDLPYVKYSKDMIFKVVKNQYNIDAEYKDIISILRLVRFFSEKEEGIG